METRRIGFQTDALLEPQAALARYFAEAQLRDPQTQHVALADAPGRYLSETIAADTAYPNAPRSAMDGFAARSADLPGRLRIAGEIRMGEAWTRSLEPGTAARIPTGGVVPEGADTVVPLEDAAVHESHVELPATPPGDAVTPAGSDMKPGEAVLTRGTRVGAAQMALLATLGFTSVPVFSRPRIAVLSSGDELVPPSARPRPGQIRDSNRYGVAAALEAMGALAFHLPTAADDALLIETSLQNALAEHDAVVLTGGSSVGEKDLTPAIVARLGDPGVIVHGLRVKPGKPTVLGSAGGKPVIGLPGNPASALAILEMIGRPIVETLLGALPQAREYTAVLAGPVHKRQGWTWYVPAALDEAAQPVKAYPLELRSSSVSLLARAQGLLVLNEETEVLEAGAQVRVRRL